MNCDCTIIKGPVGITWNGIYFLTEGEVTVRSVIDSVDLMSDKNGTFDKRLRSLAYTVAFKPLGTYTTLAALLNHIAGLRPGQDIFRPAGADLPLIITPLTDQGFTAGTAGEIITFAKAALTGIPALKFSTGAQMLESVTFTCIKATGVEQNTDDAFFSRAQWTSTLAAAFITAADVEESDILTAQWEGNWSVNPASPASGDPWGDFETVDGFSISFDRKLAEVKTDNCGYIGSTMTDMTAKITFIPCLTSTAVAATNTLTITANPTDNDTITINGRTYRFKGTLAAINDVKIGASLSATLTSLQKTINGTGVAGTDMFTGTVLDAYVTAGTPTSTTILFTAKVAGSEANDITATNPVDTGGVITWAGATFSGGTGSRLENTLLGHPFHNEATNGVAIGGAVSGAARILHLTGTTAGASDVVVMEFLRAQLTGFGIRYGAQPLRQGEVEFTATQRFSGDMLTINVD